MRQARGAWMFGFVNGAKGLLGRWAKALLGDFHPVVNRLRRWNSAFDRMLMRMYRTPRAAKRTPGQASYSTQATGANIAGFIESGHGVGEAVRSNIRAFDAAKIPYVLNNVESAARQAAADFSVFSDSNPYAINLIHVNAEQVPEFFLQKGRRYFDGKYNVGYWVWELADFPREWVAYFDHYHEIWTASQFCVDAISKVAPIPVVRVPHAIHMEKINALPLGHFGLRDDTFVFLSAFDFLSFFERKNPLALIRAFRQAFGADEKVQLVLKCSNSSANAKAFERMKEFTKGSRVTIIDAFLPKGDLNALFSLADCYVSLHRAEGFGLPLAEAMYLGKPVLATGYSGNIDFMTVNNSFLIKYRLLEIEEDIGPYRKGSVWADPDVDHAAELMRYVYEHRETGQQIGGVASEDIRSQYSPGQIGHRIRERMRVIASLGHQAN